MDEITNLKKQTKKYIDGADEKTLRMIYAMLEIDAEKDWWDDVPEDAKKSIEKGLDDLKKGKVSSHKDVMKKYKKWLS